MGDPNKLLNNYQHFQQNNNPFQNNMLLQNNPTFTSNMNYNNSTQMQQMQMMQMQKIKELQQMKQIEKLNEMENKMDKEKIKESIIRPIRIERTNKDKQELEARWKESEKQYGNSKGKNYGPEIQEYWGKRTNEAYKTIIKDPRFLKTQYKSTKDLIVHRVTDKDKEGVTEEYTDLSKKLETHNKELKVIYSTTKEAEHKKKFEYNHVYKFRMHYNPKDHDNLKNDKIKYYKEQQRKEEDGKEKMDGIYEMLVNDGIFNEEEIKSLNGNNANVSKNDKKEKYLSRQKK